MAYLTMTSHRSISPVARVFVTAFVALTCVKLAIAIALPPFSDEVFWYWESLHPAWAYADIPGLTAWLIGLGVDVFGAQPIGLRILFILMGAAIPWLAVRIAARWFPGDHAWMAGLLTLLMPISGLNGLFAAPDVPLVLAMLLSLEGIASLRDRPAPAGWLVLLLGLVVGALSHYRFAPILVAMSCGVLLDRQARQRLTDPRLGIVLLLGALAWTPLIAWNLEHAAEGVKFQFFERHPWTFQTEGIRWLPSQLLVVSPAMFALLAATLWHAARRRDVDAAPWGLLLSLGGGLVLGYFMLGFFADRNHISFHWPMPGWIVLALGAPLVLAGWRPVIRKLFWSVTAVSLTAFLVLLAVTAHQPLRTHLAGGPFYQDKFAGWGELAEAVRGLRLPEGTRIVADNFELGSQLVYALGERDVHVLDHPRNHLSGRASQILAWRRQYVPDPAATETPLLLVVEDKSIKLDQRLAANQNLCAMFGALPKPRIVNIDHGIRRFILYRFDPGADTWPVGCAMPALAYVDQPRRHDKVGRQFEVTGWAIKEAVGVARVQVTLDGAPVAQAEYGHAMPHVARFWHASTDPGLPNVGYRARVDATGARAGRHWLGLIVHGKDGSAEALPEMPILIR